MGLRESRKKLTNSYTTGPSFALRSLGKNTKKNFFLKMRDYNDL